MPRGLKSVRNRRDDALSRVGWVDLERLLAEHYRQAGYEVEHVGTGGHGRRFDGGVDLKLRRDDAYVLVQAKRWNAFQVTHNAVHELLGIMVNEGATGAILVTSGEFTHAAIQAASRHGHVQLVDGDALRAMLGPMEEPPGNPGLEVQVPRASRSGVTTSRGTRVRPGQRIWLGVAAVGMVAFVLIVHALLQRTAWTAGPSPAKATSVSPKPRAPIEAARVRAVAAPVDPDCELIDHYTGTVVCDGNVDRSNAAPALSEAEIREAQRRADEAIKVLEASTPEM